MAMFRFCQFGHLFKKQLSYSIDDKVMSNSVLERLTCKLILEKYNGVPSFFIVNLCKSVINLWPLNCFTSFKAANNRLSKEWIKENCRFSCENREHSQNTIYKILSNLTQEEMAALFLMSNPLFCFKKLNQALGWNVEIKRANENGYNYEAKIIDTDGCILETTRTSDSREHALINLLAKPSVTETILDELTSEIVTTIFFLKNSVEKTTKQKLLFVEHEKSYEQFFNFPMENALRTINLQFLGNETSFGLEIIGGWQFKYQTDKFVEYHEYCPIFVNSIKDPSIVKSPKFTCKGFQIGDQIMSIDGVHLNNISHKTATLYLRRIISNFAQNKMEIPLVVRYNPTQMSKYLQLYQFQFMEKDKYFSKDDKKSLNKPQFRPIDEKDPRPLHPINPHRKFRSAGPLPSSDFN